MRQLNFRNNHLYVLSSWLKDKYMRIFITGLLLCLVISVSAQKTEDVVYLKNGSILRGKIIEMVPDQYVKIQIAGGSIFVFQNSEIQYISKEAPFKAVKNYETKSCGYFNAASLGFLIGGSSWYYNPVSLTVSVTNGYKWQNKVYAGLTTGFEFLRVVAIPLKIEGRWDVFDSRISPYLKLNAGYLLPLDGKQTEEWDYNYTGGFGITPAVGFRSYFNNNSGFDMNFGYRYEELFSKRYDSYYQTEIERREIFNRVYFSIGFIFK